MSEKIDYSKGVYDAKKLGTGRMFILGVQHMFAMFGATVLVPLLTGLSVSTTLLCAGLEQQRAQTCAEQCGADAQAGQQRHQHGCAEHCKHVLCAEDQQLGRAKLFGIIDAFRVIDFFCHE